MVTALDQKQTLMESIRDGAIDFIVKPFDRDRIASLLQQGRRRLGLARSAAAPRPDRRGGP